MPGSQKLTSEMPITSKTMSIASISFHITYTAQLFWFIWAWCLGFCVTGACTADVDNTTGIWAVKMSRYNVIRNIIKCSILNRKNCCLKYQYSSSYSQNIFILKWSQLSVEPWKILLLYDAQTLNFGHLISAWWSELCTGIFCYM